MASANPSNPIGNSSGLEERVIEFIDEILVVDALESAFNLFLIHNPANEQFKWERRLTDWLKILADCSSAQAPNISNSSSVNGSSSEILQRQVAADPALRHFVARAASCPGANSLMLTSAMKLLETAVEKKALNARQVCDALLYSEHLKYDKPDFWLAAFGVVRRIISTIDYKGVREIMKNCIDKVLAFPAEDSDEGNKFREGRELNRQMNAAKELLAHIFDRNSALLPSYFIVNEILKSYPENPTWPHKHLVPLVSDFLNSFRPPAQMVSSVLRHRMRPVVEQNGKAHAISSWKMDPHSLKFLLKQTLTYEKVLPFSKSLCKPQTSLLRYILKQPYSKDLVNSVLGVQKPRKDSSDPTGRGPGSLSQYPMLEEQLVLLFVEAVEQSDRVLLLAESNDDSAITSQLRERTQILWWSLCSELIFFLLYQFVSFSNFIDSIHKILQEKRQNMRDNKTWTSSLSENGCSGRDELMWALLQYISGSIAKNTVTDFLPVMKLFFLYDEPTPLPVPDVKSKYCARQLAAAAIYIHLQKKVQPAANSDLNAQDTASGLNSLKFAPPIALRKHYDFLKSLGKTSLIISQSIQQDYQVPIILNTFSTDQNVFTKPMSELVAAIAISTDGGNHQMSKTQPIINGIQYIPMPGNTCFAQGATIPLSLDILDSVSVHARMAILQNILTGLVSFVSNIETSTVHFGNIRIIIYPSPALIETYVRLLTYHQIDDLGIKGLINVLLPAILKNNSWGILHMFLEIFCFRLRYMHSEIKLSFLSNMQLGLITGNDLVTKNSQLQICVEATILRLVTGLENAEMTQSINQAQGKLKTETALQSKPIIYGDSEAINRVVVLKLARAIHVNGIDYQSSIWVKETLSNIMEKTPHNWPLPTLQNFPSILQDFYKENPGPKNNKKQLSSLVEEEYKLYESMSKSMSNEQDIVQHFCEPSNTLFLCVLWQMLLEKDEIQPTAYKVIRNIGEKQLSLHIRSFCDLILYSLSAEVQSTQTDRSIDLIGKLIWQYNILNMEKFILWLILRIADENESQVCFFIIQLLLLKPKDFRCRVIELEKTMSPEHHLTKDFHTKHMDLHQKYPEKFHPDSENTNPSLPTYFGNVCLRFIPVFDIVVHRFLELPPVSKSLETLIDHMGVLYKFHDRPISYLYNTLHYYELRVRDRAMLKKKLISNIVGALKDVRPPGWCLTEQYNEYLMTEGTDWRPETADHSKMTEPGLEYYVQLVGRFARTLSGNNCKESEIGSSTFPFMDWRFNEFPNEGAHALYVTCVEIMGLPLSEPAKVAHKLFDVVLEEYEVGHMDNWPDWTNAVGLIFSNLPFVYTDFLLQKLISTINQPPLSKWELSMSIFQTLSIDDECSRSIETNEIVCMLYILHSIWHHSSIAQLHKIPDLIKEKIVSLVKTEEQLVFIFHLVVPLIERFNNERQQLNTVQPIGDITLYIYRMLVSVDKAAKIKHIDILSDLLYHIKYQFTGDKMKAVIDPLIAELNPEFQQALKFISPKSTRSEEQKVNQSSMASDQRHDANSKVKYKPSNKKIKV